MEGAALFGDVVADGAAEHGVGGFERVERGGDGDGGGDVESGLVGGEVGEAAEVEGEIDADHRHTEIIRQERERSLVGGLFRGGDRCCDGADFGSRGCERQRDDGVGCCGISVQGYIDSCDGLGAGGGAAGEDGAAENFGGKRGQLEGGGRGIEDVEIDRFVAIG